MAIFRRVIIGVNIRTQAVGVNHRVGMSKEVGGSEGDIAVGPEMWGGEVPEMPDGEIPEPETQGEIGEFSWWVEIEKVLIDTSLCSIFLGEGERVWNVIN